MKCCGSPFSWVRKILVVRHLRSRNVNAVGCHNQHSLLSSKQLQTCTCFDPTTDKTVVIRTTQCNNAGFRSQHCNNPMFSLSPAEQAFVLQADLQQPTCFDTPNANSKVRRNNCNIDASRPNYCKDTCVSNQRLPDPVLVGTKLQKRTVLDPTPAEI